MAAAAAAAAAGELVPSSSPCSHPLPSRPTKFRVRRRSVARAPSEDGSRDGARARAASGAAGARRGEAGGAIVRGGPPAGWCGARAGGVRGGAAARARGGDGERGGRGSGLLRGARLIATGCLLVISSETSRIEVDLREMELNCRRDAAFLYSSNICEQHVAAANEIGWPQTRVTMPASYNNIVTLPSIEISVIKLGIHCL
jgi:hypothetical protein